MLPNGIAAMLPEGDLVRLTEWEEEIACSGGEDLHSIYCYDSFPSTMDFPLAEDAPVGTLSLVLARTQSGGRGTHGRRWESPAGGFWGTWYFIHDAGPEAWQGFTIAVGKLLLNILQDTLPKEPAYALKIKWPNDILFESSGQKVAGILVEAKGRCLRIGVGVNLTNSTDDVPSAVSLQEYMHLVRGEVVSHSVSTPVQLAQSVTPGLLELCREGWTGYAIPDGVQET